MIRAGLSKSLTLLFAFFILHFPFSKEALSWRGQAHTRMTNDALKVMPKMTGLPLLW